MRVIQAISPERHSKPLSRRVFLLRTSSLVAAGIALPATLSACSPGGTLPTVSHQPANLSQTHFGLLARMSEILIPETDTSGAIGAGVPQFIDALMGHWASAETRESLEAALDEIDAIAKASHRRAFVEIRTKQQESLLASFEAECFGETDAPESQTAAFSSDVAAGYRKLKELVYVGYYRSEIGCTQELQYELIPGPDARSDAPLSEVGRTWVSF